MKTFFAAPLILSLTIVSVTPTNLKADSHAIEVSMQNCMHAKMFALHVIERRNENRPIKDYEKIVFESPAALEIIDDAYKTENLNAKSNRRKMEINFSEKWMNQCFEFSCSGFWADLEIALAKIKN
jgi:hypothetical protein|tara:strand:+ start:169 stop:546 length:378 start_codon:yes stop_codon:yes gene_type:complete